MAKTESAGIAGAIKKTPPAKIERDATLG